MIEDVDSYTYNYYFSDIKNNKIVLPYVCSRNIESCKNYVKNLPKGDYCFISVYKINKNEFIPQKEIEKSIFKNSAAIFFKHL